MLSTTDQSTNTVQTAQPITEAQSTIPTSPATATTQPMLSTTDQPTNTVQTATTSQPTQTETQPITEAQSTIPTSPATATTQPMLSTTDQSTNTVQSSQPITEAQSTITTSPATATTQPMLSTTAQSTNTVQTATISQPTQTETQPITEAQSTIPTSPATATTQPMLSTTTPTPTTPTTTITPTTTTKTTTTTPPTTRTTTMTTTVITTTTTTTTATPAPTRPPPVVTLELVILLVFSQDLQITTSEAFRKLAYQVETECNKVYKKKYGPLFIKVIVIAFRAFTKTRAVENVKAELEIVFNQTSNAPIPSNTEIVQTLKEAATTPNSGFNLTIDVNTIAVIKSLQIIPLTILTDGAFRVVLFNKSSIEFQNRATMIKTGLEPFFFADYPISFSVITVTNFSDASVKTRSVPTIRNSMDLTFAANALLPNSNQIVNTIVRAAKNNTLPFQIFTSEIVINGTSFSSAEVSRKISALTALLLVAVSLLVPWFD
ncbi:location of vulva defective 1 [Pseudorasbora parva]|uniref:location of vulva defective 1 n=1 Tax=Pseudorasbora parva TaxID=51549 RepID=UPI00351ED790